jgi:hypothetical protein
MGYFQISNSNCLSINIYYDLFDLRALKGHNRTHLNSAPYLCNMCPYSSSDKSTLIRHMRTHNGERPFQCKLCQYAFTTKANCERHLRNRHGQKTRDDIRRSIIFHHTEDGEGFSDGKRSVSGDVPIKRESQFEEKKVFKPSIVFPGSGASPGGSDSDSRSGSGSGSHPLAHSSPVPIEVEPDLAEFRLQGEEVSNGAENPLDLTKKEDRTKQTRSPDEVDEFNPQDLTVKNGGVKTQKPVPMAFPLSPRDILKDSPRMTQMCMPPLPENPFPLYMSQYHRPGGNFLFYPPTSGPVPVPVPVPVPMGPLGMGMMPEEPNPALLMDLKNYFEKMKRDLSIGSGLVPGIPPDMALLAADPRFYACWKDYMNLSRGGEKEEGVGEKTSPVPEMRPLATPTMAKISVSMPLKPSSPTHKTSVQASGTARIPSASAKEVPVGNMEDASMVKLVIKNGVLMRKQKQRRYRTERPFVCEHCSARFTLRSNMERHIKQQHPQFWSQKPRGGRRFPGLTLTGNTILKDNGMDGVVGETVLPEMDRREQSVSGLEEEWVNSAMGEKLAALNNELADAKSQLKRLAAQQAIENDRSEEIESKDESYEYDNDQMSSGDESEASHKVDGDLVIDEDSNEAPVVKTSIEGGLNDLASVKKLLVQANSQSFQEFFKQEEDEQSDQRDNMDDGMSSKSSFDGREDSPMPSDNKTSEALSISDSSTSPAPGAEGQPVEKKKSAYSSAPHKVSCPYCQRKFPWTSSLRRHVLTHTGQKPFKCSVCPLLFTTKSNCDRHLLRKHGQSNHDPAAKFGQTDKVYTCTMCPSANFNSSAALEKHRLRMHFHAFGDQARKDSDGNGTCDGSSDEEQHVRDPVDKKGSAKAIPNLIPVKTFLCPVKDCMQVSHGHTNIDILMAVPTP